MSLKDGGEEVDDGPLYAKGPEILFYLFEDPLMLEDPKLQLLSSVIINFINLLIVIGTVALCMETMDDYDPSIHPDMKPLWENLEIFCVTMFSIDFTVRFGGAIYGGHGSTFVNDPMNWVDVLAIAPFYLKLIIGSFIDLRFMRVVRLARILRALRSERFGNMGAVISDIITSSAPALAIPLYFMLLAMILFSSIMFFAEKCGSPTMGLRPNINKDGVMLGYTSTPMNSTCCVVHGVHTGTLSSCCEEPKNTYYTHDGLVEHCTPGMCCTPDGVMRDSMMFSSIPQATWWCIVTFSTVGYGDYFPVTPFGQLVGFVTMAVGIFFLAMPLTIIGGSFTESWERIRNQQIADQSKRFQRENPDAMVELSEVIALRDGVNAHLLRMKQVLGQCQEMAPEGHQWIDLQEQLDEVTESFVPCWALYGDSGYPCC